MQEDDLTIGRYLNDAAAILAPRSDSSRLDAEILLGRILRKPRSYLHAWPEQQLSKGQAASFEALIRRRFSGEPIAYITGVREF